MPYIGKQPDGFAIRQRYTFTPNAGTTSISASDTDVNGLTLSFTDGAYVDVYLNGVKLKAGTDYVTTTANTIGSLTATVADDEIEVIVYEVFTLADMVSATNGGTFSDGVTFSGGISSSLTVANNLTLTNGDMVFGTAGKGVCLGATSATAANTIHDYEEGTYTFTVTAEGSGSYTVSSSYNTGQYVKVGQIVHAGGDLRLDSSSSPNGEVRVSLPFAAINNTKRLFVGVANTVGIDAQTSMMGAFRVRAVANEAKATVIYNTASSHFGLQGQNWSAGSNDTIVFSITYVVEE